MVILTTNWHGWWRDSHDNQCHHVKVVIAWITERLITISIVLHAAIHMPSHLPWPLMVFVGMVQWLLQFLGSCSTVLPQAQPEHIARILWGLAALGAKPPRHWMMRVYRQTLVQVRPGAESQLEQPA